MEKNKFAVIILAAGKGKRMNNPDLPKVLAEINGKPLISFVLNQVEKLNPQKKVLVVGHQKELVINYINDSEFGGVDFASQDEQLGTGHAVMQTYNLLKDFDGDVLILAGDVPLLKHESLKKFINIHNEVKSEISVLTTFAPNPSGYGRIVRDTDQNFMKIVEHKDADEQILNINEINSGIYMIKASLLYSSLEMITNNNAQKEYYLTDIIEILKNLGKSVYGINAAPFDELQGINTVDELNRAAEYYNFINKN